MIDEHTRRDELWDMAQYVAARIRGEAVQPPRWWTPEQVAQFEAIITDPAERAGIVAWTLSGLNSVDAER
jgi:hypothetical protein